MKLLALSDLAILNASDSEVAMRSTAFRGEKIFYSLDTPVPGELGLVEELLIDRAFGADPQEAHVLAELQISSHKSRTMSLMHSLQQVWREQWVFPVSYTHLTLPTNREV